MGLCFAEGRWRISQSLDSCELVLPTTFLAVAVTLSISISLSPLIDSISVEFPDGYIMLQTKEHSFRHLEKFASHSLADKNKGVK